MGAHCTTMLSGPYSDSEMATTLQSTPRLRLLYATSEGNATKQREPRASDTTDRFIVEMRRPDKTRVYCFLNRLVAGSAFANPASAGNGMITAATHSPSEQGITFNKEAWESFLNSKSSADI